MKRQIIAGMLAVAVLAGAILVSGCQTEAQNKALWGTAIGAGAGQLIGRDTTSTLIGAGLGAGAGYMLGNEQDKSRQRKSLEQQRWELDALRAESNVVTVWITNSNGSQLPVRLVRDGPGFIGPRGERYPTYPTEAQLRPVYGF